MSKKEGIGPWQHFIAQLHQRQFSTNGPLTKPKLAKVINYKHPDKKGVPTGAAKPYDLFSGTLTYDDDRLLGLKSDTTIISNEEKLKFNKLFWHLNGTTDFVPDDKYLAMFIGHCIKRNPAIRKGILKELTDAHTSKIVPYLNSPEFEKECRKLFERRHLLLDKILKSFDKVKNPELIPFGCLLIALVSGFDVTELTHGDEIAYLKFKNGFSEISAAGAFSRMLTSIADFVKMGHIKGLLESNLETSEYVKKLTELFKIEIVEVPAYEENSGLILPENPVCFVNLVEGKISTYRYCDYDDLKLVDYIIIPLSPTRAILASNTETSFSLRLNANSLNMLLARNAEINYISKYPGQDKYIDYMNASSFSVAPLIKEADLEGLNSVSDYLSLDGVCSLKQDLLDNAPTEDHEAYKKKIYAFYEQMGFLDPPRVSPLIAKTLLVENSKNLSLATRTTQDKLISAKDAPAYAIIAKGTALEFNFKSEISNAKKIAILVFNTGLDAITAGKHGFDLIYTTQPTYKKSRQCFVWGTSGAYIGHHLAIIVVLDDSGEIIESNKVWVEVAPSTFHLLLMRFKRIWGF